MATAVLSLCLTSLGLEVVLRFLPVNQSAWPEPVNAENPVLRLRPNRTFTYSKFGAFHMANTVHVNNFGFVSDQDYLVNDPHPLVAVIGDSYIEARMVPYRETVQGRLAETLRGRVRVYSYAVSGAALSQYLVWADYARRTFHPAKMIILVVGNDFYESTLAYKSEPKFHYFVKGPDGELRLVRVDYAPTPLDWVVRRSQLLMYLFNNLQVMELPETVGAFFGLWDDVSYVGNTEARTDEGRLLASKEAMRAFFRLLPEMSGLPAKDVLLAVDGIRPSLYSAVGLEKARGSHFDLMRRAFLAKATSLGYPALDMQEAFLADYAKNGRRFDFERDGHWNTYGHQVFARAILDSEFVTAGVP